MSIQIEKASPRNPMLRNEKSVYFRNFCDHEIIYIRDDLHLSHEKFYLRHELGHALLHPDTICSCDKTMINYGQMENQANYFAFKLADFDICEYECDGFSIKQLASYTEMPESVLLKVSESEV